MLWGLWWLFANTVENWSALIPQLICRQADLNQVYDVSVCIKPSWWLWIEYQCQPIQSYVFPSKHGYITYEKENEKQLELMQTDFLCRYTERAIVNRKCCAGSWLEFDSHLDVPTDNASENSSKWSLTLISHVKWQPYLLLPDSLNHNLDRRLLTEHMASHVTSDQHAINLLQVKCKQPALKEAVLLFRWMPKYFKSDDAPE